MHTDIQQCFYFETITVNFYMVKAMSPESIIAITQISEMCPEKHIYQGTQHIVTHDAYGCDIVAPSPFREPRAFGKVISGHKYVNKTRYLVRIGRTVSV